MSTISNRSDLDRATFILEIPGLVAELYQNGESSLQLNLGRKNTHAVAISHGPPRYIPISRAMYTYIGTVS